MGADSNQNRWLTAALLAPTSMWFLFMLILPLIVILVFSFGERAAVGGYAAGFTLEQYANLPSRLKAFQNTMIIAPAGTLLSLLVAYPLSFLIMYNWLEAFAYRISIGPIPFLLAAGFAFLLAGLSISYHTIRAARTNPAKVLRTQ